MGTVRCISLKTAIGSNTAGKYPKWTLLAMIKASSLLVCWNSYNSEHRNQSKRVIFHPKFLIHIPEAFFPSKFLLFFPTIVHFQLPTSTLSPFFHTSVLTRNLITTPSIVRPSPSSHSLTFPIIMSVSKPKSSLSKKRLAFHPGAASLVRQGSLAPFLQRFTPVHKPPSVTASQVLKLPHSKQPSQDPENRGVRDSTEVRRSASLARNRSWTDIYSHTVGEGGKWNGSIGDGKDPGGLNQMLNTRLREVANPGDAKEVLAAFQKTYEDLITELPSHSLILRRIKSGYDDCISKLLSSQCALTLKRQISDMQDMLDLQQVEKETLLDTVMQLRKEINTLNGNLLKKTSKIATLEKSILEVSTVKKGDESQFSLDPTDLETQKIKSTATVYKSATHKPKLSASFLTKNGPFIPRLDVPPCASIDMLSPIFADSEAFVSDKEASRTEIKESLQQFPGK